jgi:hypothetical protein
MLQEETPHLPLQNSHLEEPSRRLKSKTGVLAANLLSVRPALCCVS